MVLRLLLLSVLMLPSLVAAAPPEGGQVYVRPVDRSKYVRIDYASLDSASIAAFDENHIRHAVFDIHREMVNRERDARLRSRFAPEDSIAVRERFGIFLNEELRQVRGPALRRLFRRCVRSLRDEVHDSRRMDTWSRLRRVPVEVPSPTGSGTPANLKFETSEQVVTAGKSVAAFVHMRDIAHFDTTWMIFTDEKLEDFQVGGVGACENSELFDGPIVDVAGTAFLISDKMVVTAAHVADTPSLCSDYWVVFGYGWNLDGTARLTFSEEDVYKPVRVVYSTSNWGRDVAVVELEKAVTGRSPLANPTPVQLDDSDLLHVIGHPYGLPLVVTDSGGIIDNEPCNFFTSDIEISLFNSGSPVFNDAEAAVGVISSNFANARSYCDCWAAPVYLRSDGRSGAMATRIGVVEEYLDHPDKALVFNQLQSSGPALGASAAATGGGSTAAPPSLSAEVESGPAIPLPAGGTGTLVPVGATVTLTSGGVCVNSFIPSAGETWYVRKRGGTGPYKDLIEILRCPQDGMVAGGN